MVGIPSALNTDASIEAFKIVVDGLLVSLEKGICIFLNDWVVPLYECLLTRIELWLPFSDFKVILLKHLKVSPSQLHLRSWAYMRVFQLCVNHMSFFPWIFL